MSRIIDFEHGAAEPQPGAPPADRILRGDPRHTIWNHYSDPTGQFHAGIWEAGPGAWRVQYDAREEELCVLLEGRVRIVEEDGTARDFGPGATFVVPGGFRGIWENLERVRKVYAVTSLHEGGPSHSGDAQARQGKAE
jgi:hypothetical protein